MRFTILNLLAVTTLVALAVTFDVHGVILTMLIAAFVPTFVVGVALRVSYRVRTFTANRLASTCYSWGMLAILRWTCGKRISAWALCNYAARLAANADSTTAIEALTAVLLLDDSVPEYWVHRGAANYNVRKLKDANHDLTQALALRPNYEIALTYRGFTRLSLGERRKAIDDLSQIQCKEINHSVIAYWRGHIHETLGEWQHALEDYRLANELDPSETAAAISFARLQAGCPDEGHRNGTNAVANAYRMCVGTEWKDWVAISVLAAAHAEEGDFEAAVRFGRQALELAPEEEKTTRQQRIEQFQNRKPFRISETGGIEPARMESDATEPSIEPKA